MGGGRKGWEGVWSGSRVAVGIILPNKNSELNRGCAHFEVNWTVIGWMDGIDLLFVLSGTAELYGRLQTLRGRTHVRRALPGNQVPRHQQHMSVVPHEL